MSCTTCNVVVPSEEHRPSTRPRQVLLVDWGDVSNRVVGAHGLSFRPGVESRKKTGCSCERFGPGRRDRSDRATIRGQRWATESITTGGAGEQAVVADFAAEPWRPRRTGVFATLAGQGRAGNDRPTLPGGGSNTTRLAGSPASNRTGRDGPPIPAIAAGLQLSAGDDIRQGHVELADRQSQSSPRGPSMPGGAWSSGGFPSTRGGCGRRDPLRIASIVPSAKTRLDRLAMSSAVRSGGFTLNIGVVSRTAVGR